MLDIERHIYGRPITIVIFYFQFSVVKIFIIPKLESVRIISQGQIIRQKDEVTGTETWSYNKILLGTLTKKRSRRVS